MSLTLMYITNQVDVALLAQRAGVDEVFIDLETIGKSERQGHIDSVKSKHDICDIAAIRTVIRSSRLLVRVNPLHEGSRSEVDSVIDAGADVVMLPMFEKANDVERFVQMVDGRARVLPLVETPQAVKELSEICKVPGVDELHIGLNDLHLAYGLDFMFQLVADGTLDRIVQIIHKHEIPFGFGGIARIGHGLLPAEYIIDEHYRLGSSRAILSRSFCDMNYVRNIEEIEDHFIESVKRIRLYEESLPACNSEYFEKRHRKLVKIVSNIVGRKDLYL